MEAKSSIELEKVKKKEAAAENAYSLFPPKRVEGVNWLFDKLFSIYPKANKMEVAHARFNAFAFK